VCVFSVFLLSSAFVAGAVVGVFVTVVVVVAVSVGVSFSLRAWHFLGVSFWEISFEQSFAMGKLNNINKNGITPSDVSGGSSADSDIATASDSEGTVSNLVPDAMPSRPLPGSASHGEPGSLTEGVPPGSSTQQLPTISECARVARSFASARRALDAHGFPYLEAVSRRLGGLVTKTQAAIRKRERSLERLNRKISRLESEIQNDE